MKRRRSWDNAAPETDPRQPPEVTRVTAFRLLVFQLA